MSQRSGLRDLVPEVLNVAVPEVSNHGLLWSAGFAGDETQALHFIEDPCVLVAGQLRWRSGTKFISPRQGKRRDQGPLDEVCWCEVGRRKLIVSRLVSRNIRRQSEVRAIRAAER